MLLPIRSNLALLRSFWIVLSLGAGLIAGFVAWIPFGVSIGASVIAAGIAALTVMLPGLLFPYEIVLPYRGWNWMVRKFSDLAIRYVTGVCFGTVGFVLSLGSPSQRFELSSKEPSMWRSRGTQTAEAHLSQYREPLQPTGSHWTGPTRSWMRTTGPNLAWTLLPFLMLIRALHTGRDKKEGAPANVYTLY